MENVALWTLTLINWISTLGTIVFVCRKQRPPEMHFVSAHAIPVALEPLV